MTGPTSATAPGPRSGRRRTPQSLPSEQVHDEASLGQRLRELRRRRALSLQQLSQQAGLSVGLLSQIERGHTSPSYRSLRLLSAALGIRIEDFFLQEAPLPEDSAGVMVHPRNRRVLRFEKHGITTEYIDPDTGGTLQMMLITIEPGGQSGKDFDQHVGEEGGLVLAGTLDLNLGRRHFLLSEGDSFRFSAERPHRFSNPGLIPTRVVWFITPTLYGHEAIRRML